MNSIESKRRQLYNFIAVTLIFVVCLGFVIYLDDTKISRFFWLEHRNIKELVDSGKPENSELTPVLKAISDHHFWLFRAGLVLTIFLSFYYKDKDETRHLLYKKLSLSAILILIICSGIITWAFKIFVGRPRPYTNIFENSPVSLSTRYHSFPSGHTTETFSYILPYIYFYRNYSIGVLLFVSGLCLSFLRVTLSYHYISDVLAGIYITVIAGYFICYFLDRKIRNS